LANAVAIKSINNTHTKASLLCHTKMLVKLIPGIHSVKQLLQIYFVNKLHHFIEAVNGFYDKKGQLIK
jgi:hypothetical protein